MDTSAAIKDAAPVVDSRLGGRYASLDHVRGVAVIWVFLYHAFAPTMGSPGHPAVEVFKVAAAPGWLGVQLFFVVSGYCITESAHRNYELRRTTLQFIRDRVLRIYPVYWGALALTFALNVAATLPRHRVPWHHDLPDGILAWIGNIALVQDYLGTRYVSVVHWTLVVEIGFYAVVALLLLLARAAGKRPAVACGLLLAVAVLALPSAARAHIGFVQHWPAFVSGAAVWFALEARRIGRRLDFTLALALIAALGAGGILTAGTSTERVVRAFGAASALALVAAAPLDGDIARARGLRWMGWVGERSFSLYLLHIPVGCRLITLGSRFVTQKSLVFLLVQVAAWTVAMIASHLFYEWLERPVNAWRKSLGKERRSAPALSGAP